MVVCAETEARKQASKDALLHSVYNHQAGGQKDAQNNTLPFYQWSGTKESSEGQDYGALEMLARNINQPGTTQDAGVVLSIGLETGLIEGASPNTQRILGMELEEVLGAPPASIFGCTEEEFQAAMENSERAIPSTCSLKLAKVDKIADVSFCRSENGTVIDIEEVIESSEFDLTEAQRIAADAEKIMSEIERKEDLFLWIVNTIQHLVRFDRVKLYMFHPDQHGEVLEEALKPDSKVESCNGLHYPATDIPQRARDLFLLNHIRFINDTFQTQLKLAVIDGLNPSNIYLTSSCLRGVHPVHMEYLQNMKVTASLTFAVIIKGKLWGLIACHHGGGPLLVPRRVRTECWTIAQAFNTRLSEMLREEQDKRALQVAETQERLLALLGEDARATQLARGLDLLCSVVESNGVALVEKEGRVYKSGTVPSDPVIRNIWTHTKHQIEREGVYAIDSITKQLELSASREEMGGAAGVLVVKVSPGCYVMWFREEIVQQVHWGADDNKEGTPNLFGARESFSQWVEEVSGECRRWCTNDCADVQKVGMAIDDRIVALSKSAEFVTDSNGTILHWNLEMVALCGLKAELALGKKLPQVCFYADQQEVEAWITAFRNGRRTERRLKLNVCTQRYSEPVPEPLLFVCVKSINALAQPTLRFMSHSEKQPPVNADVSHLGDVGHIIGIRPGGRVYNLPQDFHVLDEASSPFWIMDANPAGRTFLWCNEETCKVLKFTKNEFHCLDLQPDLVDARVMQMWFERVQQSNQVLRGNHVFYYKSASVAMDVEVAPIKVQTAGGVRTVCMVSARGVGTESPHISEGSMRSHEMLQVSKVMMMLFRESGQMIDCNLSAKVYYSMALAKESIALRDVFESCEWANKEECEEAYQKMLKVCKGGHGKIFELERVKQHVQSGVVHLLQFFSARDPETGEFAISVNETDISRMKSVQNELIAAQQQQERFLAATSHELRTPLHAILALTGSLLRDAGLGQHAVRILKLIQSSGHSLTTLVDDILDAAALRAGVLVLKSEAVDLHQLVANVFEVCGPMAARGVNTINDVPTDLGSIKSDSARLTQILMNLVGNSVKFTSSGHIKIAATMDTKRSQVHLIVSDTGKGVPTEKLNTIWEAFGQAESGAGGTGLGLTIVQSLVKAMGGAIQLTSSTNAKDHGTVFTIVLPRDRKGQVTRLPTQRSGDAEESEETGTAAASEVLKGTSPPNPNAGVEEPKSPWSSFLREQVGQVPSLGQLESYRSKPLAQMRHQLTEAQEKLRIQEREIHALKAAGRASNAMMPPKAEVTVHMASTSTQEVFLLGDKELSPEEMRALEVIECPIRCLSLAEAMHAVEQERLIPMVVLLNAASLGNELQPACNWARALSEVAVVMLASNEAEAVKAVELGCTGLLRMPLVASELTQELARQRDAKRLWLRSEVLRECAAPVTDAVAKRTRLLRADQRGSVRVHDRLGALALQFEVNVEEGPSEAMLNLCELVLKRCEELVASATAQHGALVVDSAGGKVLVVTGHDGESENKAGDKAAIQASLSSAYQVALLVMRKLREEEQNLDDYGVQISLRAGVSAGRSYEGLVGVAQDQLAFFGEPVTEAAKLAGLAEDGQIGISSECFARLYPGSEAGDKDVCFFSLRAEKPGWNAPGRPQAVARTQPAADQPAQFLPFAQFANRLLRVSKAAQERNPGEPISHMDLKLVSKVLARTEQLPVPGKRAWELAEEQATVEAWKNMLESSEHDGSDRCVRVLSVDDNPVNQVVIESALLPLGHEVLTCMDTPDVFEMLDKMEGLPDIILLDVMLPSGSGVDVLRELRKTYSSTDLPIILVSGKSSKDAIIEGLQAGGNDYIVKPFDIAELVCRINTQLNVSSMVTVRMDLARRSELLNKMLPREIVPQILRGETPVHHHMPHASFLVVEIVGFSELSRQAQTVELIELLSALYADFDLLCDKHDVFKVETDADSYIVASGHTDARADEDHTTKLVHIGLDIIRQSRKYTNSVTGNFIEVRLGISSGPTSAGVISAKLPHYCFFGQTINVAKKMQQHGFPSTITLSAEAKALIEKSVECLSLGIRVIPGNGPMETFLVKHKICPWEHAVEAACHAHNFVGYADGSTVPGTPASLVRGVPSSSERPAQFRPRRTRGPPPPTKADAAKQEQADATASGGGSGGSGEDEVLRLDMAAAALAPRSPNRAQTSRSPAVRPMGRAPSHRSPVERVAGGRAGERGERGGRLSQSSEDSGSETTARKSSRASSASQAVTSLTEPQLAMALVPRNQPPPIEQNPLIEILTRANLLHLREELVTNGVDIGTLSHSSDSELEFLGVKAKGERLKVQRFARAWQTLYGA